MTITSSDRALIDAAIAAGRVRVVPPGLSARPYPVWSGGRLVNADGDPGSAAPALVRKVQWRARRVAAEVLPHHQAVLDLHAQGKIVRDICAALELPEGAVRDILARYGLPANRIPRELRSAEASVRARLREAQRRTPERAAQRERLTVLFHQGASVPEMCRALNLNRDQVRSVLRDLGLRMPDRGKVQAVAA